MRQWREGLIACNTRHKLRDNVQDTATSGIVLIHTTCMSFLSVNSGHGTLEHIHVPINNE